VTYCAGQDGDGKDVVDDEGDVCDVMGETISLGEVEVLKLVLCKKSACLEGELGLH